eukprot:3889831-Rhodomonas_salina.2
MAAGAWVGQVLQEQMKSGKVLAAHAAKTLSVMFADNRALKEQVPDVYKHNRMLSRKHTREGAGSWNPFRKRDFISSVASLECQRTRHRLGRLPAHALRRSARAATQQPQRRHQAHPGQRENLRVLAAPTLEQNSDGTGSDDSDKAWGCVNAGPRRGPMAAEPEDAAADHQHRVARRRDRPAVDVPRACRGWAHAWRSDSQEQESGLGGSDCECDPTRF